MVTAPCRSAVLTALWFSASRKSPANPEAAHGLGVSVPTPRDGVEGGWAGTGRQSAPGGCQPTPTHGSPVLPRLGAEQPLRLERDLIFQDPVAGPAQLVGQGFD